MKANEFVKKFGLDLAKEYADECPSYCNYLHENGFYSISEAWQLNEKHVLVLDLKRLVESHELIESCGGLESVGEKLTHGMYESRAVIDRLKQAILDMESCQ